MTQFWNDRYSQEAYLFGEAPNAFLASQLALVKTCKTAFVPGDGEGRNGVWLAKQGLTVTSCDLAKVGVTKAKALAARHGVTINAIQANLLEYTFAPESFDLIVSIFLHFAPAERKIAYRKLWQALKPQGILLIEGYHPDHIDLRAKFNSTGGPNERDKLITAQSLREDFPNAEFLLLEEKQLVLDEGSAHCGESKVTRGVLRKV